MSEKTDECKTSESYTSDHVQIKEEPKDADIKVSRSILYSCNG